MVTSRHLTDSAPIDIDYRPPQRRRGLPVEVVGRASVLDRKPGKLADRERVGFHLLIVCTSGHGTHVVDFETFDLSAGTCLRVNPGQVQQFVTDPVFDAYMVVWPIEAHPADPDAPAWYPGCGATTCWQPDADVFAKVLGTVEELRDEQERFDGSPRRIAFMQALLSSLVLRVAIEIPKSVPDAGGLPEPYVAFRERIEERLYERPTVNELAKEIGYSSRTLDRACQRVSGQTAKQVLDDRTALEIRRLLTHTDRAFSRIGADFGFHDPSNFSKFVKRHLGRLPSDVRDGP